MMLAKARRGGRGKKAGEGGGWERDRRLSRGHGQLDGMISVGRCARPINTCGRID
jgi:hypothetical protein